MEPTNRLRWVIRKTNDPFLPLATTRILQQLWQETTTRWDEDTVEMHTIIVAEEWRDVPLEDEKP